MQQQIECWDHCDSCGRSQNRFWVYSAEQFEREKAGSLKHNCKFCHGSLVSYHEKNDLFSIAPIDI